MFSGTLRTRERLRLAGDDERGEGHRDQRVRPRRGRRARVGRRRADRQAVGAGRRQDRRHDRRPPADDPAGSTSPRRRWRPSSCPTAPADRGALHVALDPARRAGPADQPAPGRRARQELYVSLYGEVQKEVIEATLADEYGIDVELPRDDDDLHRAAGRHRRGGRGDRRRRATRSSPRSGCASSRRRSAAACASAGGRARRRCRSRSCSAVEEHRARDAAPGPARLAGDRLRGDHDAFRLRAPAEPLARHLRQEHVEHRRRLPPAHAAGADDRARAGRDHGLRAGAPVRAGAPGRHARRDGGRCSPRCAPSRCAPTAAARRPCWRARSRRRACTS